MRLDKVTAKLDEIFEMPYNYQLLRQFARDLAYELPRNNVVNLSQFRMLVTNSRIGNDASAQTLFARGILFGLVDVCIAYEACIKNEFEKRFLAHLAHDVCLEWHAAFSSNPQSLVFTHFVGHCESCASCQEILERSGNGNDMPISSFLTH